MMSVSWFPEKRKPQLDDRFKASIKKNKHCYFQRGNAASILKTFSNLETVELFLARLERSADSSTVFVCILSILLYFC